MNRLNTILPNGDRVATPEAVEAPAPPQFQFGEGKGLSERQQDVQKLAIGAGAALGGITLGRCIRLIIDVFLAHLLGPASFGLYAIGWTIARMVSFISPLGLDAGVIRFGSQSWPDDSARLKGVILQAWEFASLSGLVLGATFFLLAPWLGQKVFHHAALVPVLRWFALAFPLMTLLRVVSATTRISQRMKFSVSAEELGQPGVALFLIVIFGLAGWKLGGAAAAIVISFGLSLALAVYYVLKLFPVLRVVEVKARLAGTELFFFSVPTAFSFVFGMFLIWVDRLFVGYYRSAAEAGIYHAASQLSIALAAILSAFGAIVSPMVAHLYHRGRIDRLQELFRVSTKWSLYLCIPPFLLMCFIPQEVMAVLFGGAYGVGGRVLTILGMGQLVNAGTGAVGALLVMTGNQNRIAALTGGALLANLTFALVLVPRLGMSGAAWGTAGAVAALSALSVLVVRRVLGIWPYDRRYWKGLLSAATAAGALFFLRGLPYVSPLVTLAVTGTVALIVFTVTLLCLGLDVEDREFISMISERIRCTLRT